MACVFKLCFNGQRCMHVNCMEMERFVVFLNFFGSRHVTIIACVVNVPIDV